MSAECLDFRRLGKQRVEAKQIYNILTGQAKSNAWKNHPAVLMWRGFEPALAYYYNCIVKEWVKRGYKNNMPEILISEQIIMPPWMGNEDFHNSHRSNLLRKDYNFYQRYNWNVSPDLPYILPV